MLKDSFYFSHDANARHDLKCVTLLDQHGYEGYGIFWALIEMLRSENNSRLPLKKINAIARSLGIEHELLKKVFKTCTEAGLFDTDDEYFWSKRLNANIEEYKNKSDIAKKAAFKSWESRRKNSEVDKVL